MAVAMTPMMHRLLDYFAEHASPEEILALSPSQEELERAEELLERATLDSLLPEEKVELEQMRYLDRQIMLLKAQTSGKGNCSASPQ